MGLAVISWERLEQNERTGEAAWVPYPLDVAARLEAVFLSHQVCACCSLLFHRVELPCRAQPGEVEGLSLVLLRYLRPCSDR